MLIGKLLISKVVNSIVILLILNETFVVVLYDYYVVKVNEQRIKVDF